MLILGFHMFVLPYFRLLSPETGPWDMAISAATVLLFYPIILFCERHLPLLMGKYRAAKPMTTAEKSTQKGQNMIKY